MINKIKPFRPLALTALVLIVWSVAFHFLSKPGSNHQQWMIVAALVGATIQVSLRTDKSKIMMNVVAGIVGAAVMVGSILIVPF